MPEGSYELVWTPDGYTARISARGTAVLATPAINRGTAFTAAERRELGLTGLLPSGVSTLDRQLRRTYAQYTRQSDDLAKWVYLTNLRSRNDVLFYKLLSEHIEEMLPIVYTPTVGLAIERFSNEFRRTKGVYLSVDHPEEVELALRHAGLGADDVDLLVATDSEGILGIGDQGVGGIEISVGKLAVYTAAAGIHPSRVLPVVLDVGTDNLALLNDEMYLGERHARVRDERYDQLIDAYVTASQKLFPHAMLHWEDFGASNARRILDKYSDQVCTFNDDMQGTAAVVLAAAFSAVRAAGSRMRDQRVVIHGAGTAGLGIADMMRDQMVREGLSHEEATRRFYALGRHGILGDDRREHLLDFQQPYARPWDEVSASFARVLRAVQLGLAADGPGPLDTETRLPELVLKPRSGSGGRGVLIGPRADAGALERARAAVLAAPGEWIAQEPVALSTHPTVVDGRLAPRHVDLRAFVMPAAGVVAPGGLSRVALAEGDLVVNCSQGGGGKDTWVVDGDAGARGVRG